MIIRQSTARTILVGPVLDSTGAAKTDEVVGNIKVTKNGTVGAADGSATLTHDHAGKYKLALTANDCDTVGVLEISLNSGTNDMPVKACNVVETAIWDALFADGATGLLPANVTHFGGNAGTFNSGIPTAALDSSARVKLDASQPDYAPATAAALATAYTVIQLTDADVSAMEGRLPADPADQSAVEAAITAATSPLATSSALSTAAGNITTILGKFTGITFLSRWLGALAGKIADTTTRAEINATTAGAGYNETTDSQQAIKDALGSSGGGPAYSSAVVAARLPVGSAAGWPQEIICGSAYLTALGTHIPVYVKDVDDNILAELGDKTFTDGDFKAILRLSPLTDANKLLAQPAATIEVDSDDSPGIVFNDDVSGEEYFELQMPKAKTALGEIRTRYLCQLILRWGDGSAYEWYVNLGESKFIRGVGAAT